ncbi:hypothetical protein [Shimia sp.]
MSKQARFIKSVIASAAADSPALPWTRGARRAAFIARRNQSEPERKAA